MSRAFQACVRAYELICKPELRANESDDSRDEEEVSDEDEENTEINGICGCYQCTSRYDGGCL